MAPVTAVPPEPNDGSETITVSTLTAQVVVIQKDEEVLPSKDTTAPTRNIKVVASSSACPRPIHSPIHPPSSCTCRLRAGLDWFRWWASKMKGLEGIPPNSVPPSWYHSFVSLFQSTVSIALLAYFSTFWSQYEDRLLIVASFGASAVLVHSAIKSPLAQPRNLIGGHMVSAFTGVTLYKLLGAEVPWLAAGLAVGLAIFFMERTHTLHPPGGASALIAVIGSDEIHRQGYIYVLTPCLLGPLVMLIIALAINNMDPTRQYPVAWDTSPFSGPCNKIATKLKVADPGAVAAAETPASEDPRDVL